VDRFLVEQAAHGRNHGLNRSTKPHISGTPRRSAQATSVRVLSRSGVTGFSTRIGFAELEQRARGSLVEGGRGRDHHGVATCGSVEVLGKGAAEAVRERAHPLGIRVDDHREVGAIRLRDDARVVGPIAPAPTSAIRARAPMGAVSAWRTAQIGN